MKIQSKSNNQGSASERVKDIISETILETLELDQEKVYQHYKNYLSHNLAKEVARINLPLSLYTELYFKIDLHNFLHFVKLRDDSHAQEEIQELANIMFLLIKDKFPFACEAFEIYIKNSITFSSHELHLLKSLIENSNVIDESYLDLFISRNIPEKMSEREIKEFKEKITNKVLTI